MTDVWTVRVPGCGWLTSNPKSTGDRYRRSKTIRAWRQAVVVACTAAKLPTAVTPVHIHAEVRHAGRSPVRDRLNLAPTIKAVVDGLTPARLWMRKGVLHMSPGYGFLPDDSDRHVLSTDWSITSSGVASSWVDLTLTRGEA